VSKIVDNEEYLSNKEAIALSGASKQSFYKNAKPYLRVYHFDAKLAPWYKKSDVLAFKSGKPARKASLSINGIQRDWTTFLRALGYDAQTKTRAIEPAKLPPDVVVTFGLNADQQFIKRSRMTYVDGDPICVWSTYYPLKLVEGTILNEIEQNMSTDVVKRIKEEHGIVVGWGKDKYTARFATFKEQEILQLHINEPVLILQRVSYTEDRKTLVLYSEMTLLGSWFAPEHEYEVNIW